MSGGVYSDAAKRAKGYYYEFIETALKKINELSSVKEKTYWYIADNGWTKKDKRKFEKRIKKKGNVKIKYFKTAKKFIKLLNSKN